jgi:hypothetical protein
MSNEKTTVKISWKLILFVLGSLLVLNHLEGQDIAAEKRLYCENVADFTWPDTKKFDCKN